MLTQVSAANRALQQVALGLLDDHLRHCVIDAARSAPDEGAAKLDELAGTLRQALRLQPGPSDGFRACACAREATR